MGVLECIFTVVTVPYSKVIWAIRKARIEMGILKLRHRQNKNPNMFVSIGITDIDLNPEGDSVSSEYAKLSLSITSGLLSDIYLDTLLGTLSLDGINPPDKFEIFPSEFLVIKKTGQINRYDNITVPLSSKSKDHLRLKRSQNAPVVGMVNLFGYRKGKVIIDQTQSTKSLMVRGVQ